MRNDKINMKKLLIIICILILAQFNLGVTKAPEKNRKIFKNIYIQEINIGGMSRGESIRKILEVYNLKPIHIIYEEKSWVINPFDIDLIFHVDESIENAYKYTRGNKKIDNLNKMYNLTFKDMYKIDLEASYNETKLSTIIEVISKDMNIDVENATIEISDSGEIVTTPSKEGRKVDVIKLKEYIYNMIMDNKIENIELPINTIYPTIKTEDVKSINVELGNYSTSFNEHSSRGSNIHVAALGSSNKLIMPKGIFSYNDATGYRSYSNGYKIAKVIVGGKYVNGEGGGVCQVSTTIYNAALLSGMQIEEVHNHTFPSRYAPRGRDAAVSYGYTDFKFKNPYSHPVYVKNIVNNGAITSKIYGSSKDKEKVYIKTEEQYEKEKIDVKTYRVYLDDSNNKIREELISKSRYKTK